MDRLAELQDKRRADERFLSHRETHELLRLQEQAIVRLTLEVNKLATACGHWEADWMERGNEIERLREELHHSRGLLETASDAWECGQWNSLLGMQQQYLTRAWFQEAAKAGGDDE